MAENFVISQGLEVVTTPTFEWLEDKLKACRNSLIIGSPYVNGGLGQLMSLVKKDLPRTLVTRTDLRDFAVGASNLATICSLSEEGVDVRTLSDIHAKVYVVDESMALVTSANATYSGLYRSRECGLATRDPDVARYLASFILSGLGSEKPPRKMSIRDLRDLHNSLEAIKVNVPERMNHEYQGEGESFGEAVFSFNDMEKMLDGFRGWSKLTLHGVMRMPDSNFVLDDVYNACAAAAAKEYPKNRNVSAKLRQQLQHLRDLGIVEFVDNQGRYRRLISLEEKIR